MEFLFLIVYGMNMFLSLGICEDVNICADLGYFVYDVKGII